MPRAEMEYRLALGETGSCLERAAQSGDRVFVLVNDVLHIFSEYPRAAQFEQGLGSGIEVADTHIGSHQQDGGGQVVEKPGM